MRLLWRGSKSASVLRATLERELHDDFCFHGFIVRWLRPRPSVVNPYVELAFNHAWPLFDSWLELAWTTRCRRMLGDFAHNRATTMTRSAAETSSPDVAPQPSAA